MQTSAWGGHNYRSGQAILHTLQHSTALNPDCLLLPPTRPQLSIRSSNSPHTAALYSPKPALSAIATYQPHTPLHSTHQPSLPTDRYTPTVAHSDTPLTVRSTAVRLIITVTTGKDHSKQTDRLHYCYKFGTLDPPLVSQHPLCSNRCMRIWKNRTVCL